VNGRRLKNAAVARNTIALLLASATAHACAPDIERAPLLIPDSVVTGEIERLVEVRESSSVFTVFALLNAAGYDEELSGEMHPVRRAVRSALPRVLGDSAFERLGVYYAAHIADADAAAYTLFTLATSGPPDFTPPTVGAGDTVIAPLSRSLAELPALLRMFYQAFGGDSAYASQRTAYLAYISDYRASIEREVRDVFRYARVSSENELGRRRERGDHEATMADEHRREHAARELDRVIIIPNLLMSYERAYTFALSDTTYTVEGPRRIIRYDPHDFLHLVVQGALRDSSVRAAIAQRSAPAFDIAHNSPALASIATPEEFVEESLVRAVALRYRATRPGMQESHLSEEAARQARDGFVLVPWLYEQLKRFERQRQSLQAYCPRLFSRLDAESEARKWS
jgi:hypothetical protein